LQRPEALHVANHSRNLSVKNILLLKTSEISSSFTPHSRTAHSAQGVGAQRRSEYRGQAAPHGFEGIVPTGVETLVVSKPLQSRFPPFLKSKSDKKPDTDFKIFLKSSFWKNRESGDSAKSGSNLHSCNELRHFLNLRPFARRLDDSCLQPLSWRRGHRHAADKRFVDNRCACPINFGPPGVKSTRRAVEGATRKL
jgi:hypothetical protein